MTVLTQAQQKSGSAFANIAFSSASKTANGVPIRLIPKSDPGGRWVFDGVTYADIGFSFQNGKWVANLSGSWIAISETCEELGSAADENISAWVECLATTAHELKHIEFAEWATEKCFAQAIAAGGDEAAQNAAIVACQMAFDAWDACMRAADPEGQNLTEESWAAYKTGLCLCQEACNAPEDSDLQDELMKQANRELADACSNWMLGQAIENAGGCGSSPVGLPPLGTPASSAPNFPEDGPQISTCTCPLSIEFDPCAETPDGSGQ